MSQTSVLVLLPLYVLQLGYGPSVAALMLASRGVGQLLGDVPAGMVAGRWGDRTCLILGNAGYVVGYSLITLTSDIWLLGLGGIITGMAMSFSLLGRQSYISHRAAPNQRGRVISLMAGGMRIGSLIGPAVGGLAAAQLGYQITFGAMVVLALTALLIVLFSAEKGERESSKIPHGLRAIRDVIVEHKHAFWTAGLAMIALQFMRAGRVALLPLAGNAMGLDVDEVGLVVSAAALMDSLIFMPAGIAMDRWGRKAVAAPSLLLFAIGLALLGWADTFPLLLAAALLIGTGNGLSAGVVMVLGTDFAPQHGRARFMGVWKLVSDSGQAAAPLVISGLLSFASLLLCSQLVALTGLAGFYWMKTRVTETLVKEPR
nr:MFS transporter [Oceanobacter mangrovi]